MVESVWSVTLALLVTACGLVYLFLIWNIGYWRKRGIREAKSYPLLGTFPSAFTQKQHMSYDIDEVYRKYKNTENFVGVFSSRNPQLLVLDPEYVHRIYVNDFKHFHDNEFSAIVDDKSDVIMSNNPFTSTGEKWKENRKEVVGGLTMNRIKNTYPATEAVCQRLNNYIRAQMKKTAGNGIQTNDLSLLFTCDLVSDCVLGIDAGCMSDKPSHILTMTQKIFQNDLMFILYSLLLGIFPGIKKFYKMRFFPKDITEYFSNIMRQSIELRRTQNIDRVDILHHLMELQDKKKLSMPQVTSRAMTFLIDGFITTSGGLAHTLLLLARNPATQDKLRKEITENLDENGVLSFEKLLELPYLDACIHESLRLFSPMQFNGKICTIPYEFTNKDGVKLKVNVDDLVVIPSYSLHHDEQFYPAPEEFQPERFLPENGGVRKYRDQGVYLAFGDGPRICLGMRFALAQSKAAIVEIVRNFNVKMHSKTRLDNMMDEKMFLSSLKGGIWLEYEALN